MSDPTATGAAGAAGPDNRRALEAAVMRSGRRLQSSLDDAYECRTPTACSSRSYVIHIAQRRIVMPDSAFTDPRARAGDTGGLSRPRQ